MAIAAPAFAADIYVPASGESVVPPSGDPLYSPQPMVTGHLDLGFGLLGVEGDDDTLGVFTGAGRANVPFSGGAWNLELETGGFALFQDGEGTSSIGAAGHLWRRLGHGAVGVYGAANFPFSTTVGTAGIEGEVYYGNVTLGANADYNWSEFSDFWRVRGEADAYLMPDFRVGGELTFLGSDFGNAWSAMLDTEYRFTGTPFSVWAEGNYSWSDATSGGGVWAGLVGFRVFMDGAGETLQGHDRQVPWDSGLLDYRLLIAD